MLTERRAPAFDDAPKTRDVDVAAQREAAGIHNGASPLCIGGVIFDIDGSDNRPAGRGFVR